MAFDATKGFPGEGPIVFDIDRSEASDQGHDESDGERRDQRHDEEPDDERHDERHDEEMGDGEAGVVPALACTFERITNHKKDGGECSNCARPF
eukprot:15683092-Heterocapsa_arctica.AAC.1